MSAPTPESLSKTHTEEAEQTALFCWASLPETQQLYPQLKWMFAIPNGGLRDKITAGKLKAAGVKAGVWDIFLPVPITLFKGAGGINWYHGLFIELKVGTNTLSDRQQEFKEFICRMNYAYSVCYSWEQARDTIISYLSY